MERGTLDLLLARPLRPYKLLLGRSLAFILAAFAVGGIMFLGTVLGSRIGGISGEVVWGNFGWLAFNAVMLMLAMSGLGYLCSALAQRGSQAVAWAGGLIVSMFFIGWFATMWDKVEPFAPLSIFYYYQPDKVINGTPNWWINITMLLGVTLFTFTTAILIFERRDLTR